MMGELSSILRELSFRPLRPVEQNFHAQNTNRSARSKSPLAAFRFHVVELQRARGLPGDLAPSRICGLASPHRHLALRCQSTLRI